MRIAQISFYTDPAGREPEQLLRDWPSLSDVAECAACAGPEVSVVQASTHTQTLRRNQVDYHFLPYGAELEARSNGAFFRLPSSLDPEVMHVHGLGFPKDVAALAANGPEAPIVLQDHANQPPRLWRRSAWRRGLAAVSGVAFCSRAQALPFERARLLPSRTPIYEIPESTSRFGPGDQGAARAVTGLAGNPAVLWVGHLNTNKDPLTILDGISIASGVLPGLRLYCCFADAPLLEGVKERISADPHLRNNTQLLGRVPHGEIEQLMRAADIFVLGSHREGSGYSLLEALACGLPPVVTDIPSFRTLTGNGTVGKLWPCGDSNALAAALTAIAAEPRRGAWLAAREHFKRELSFDAVGQKLLRMYEDQVHRHAASRQPRTRQKA